MERRVLLAIFLSFLVLYTYQALFVKPAPKPVEGLATTTVPPGAVEGVAAGSPLPAGTVPAEPTSTATALVGETAERDVRVETQQVIAIFTNRGGRLKSWRLKEYRDNQGDALELVANDIGNPHPLPFSLSVPDAQVTATLNNALYAVRSAPASDAVQNGPAEVVLEYRDNSGLSSVKRFRMEAAAYTVSFDAAVAQGDRGLTPAIVWGPGLGDHDAQAVRSAVPAGGLFAVAGKVTRLAAGSVADQPTTDQDFEYVGIDDHYFAAFAFKPGPSKISYEAVSIPPPAGSQATARALMSFSLLPAGAPRATTFYVGPKNFDTLAAIDRNLVKAINFGMFSVLVVPLLRSLNWIHSYIGNYGWAIFLLTVFINIVLFPLNHKSVVSMRKMQEIQPEAKAIQERYSKLKATDPARQKMNQELMALYRARGVNPASGCVPILLTLPVFLAFYALLTTAIELRGAPFFGWMHDLSQPDPYYVMPVLVGLSQIITQWMTPQAGMDPTQQKMMLIMPVVLIFVFISTPVGALIYWLVGNVWRLGQQYLTNYLIGPPNVRAVRPAAERRVKRVGSGKTDAAAREKSDG